ncbi:MAG: hypothetical protein A2W01_11160 [Candidatus Solincola sediminis]|uniref:Uncharacterized protein n=1 Tax=Candidatus Solincola sediminis TaxID=1797199 RepID=A0A1F2WNU5_9ACTN|nr:MAG: hypothetical protein A2W01_11160 [Candidatus Solincola sediminis]OFW58516.1 MAG: hypothetical protein A2Y75_02915 [Candidatus Solincola sediminis]
MKAKHEQRLESSAKARVAIGLIEVGVASAGMTDCAESLRDYLAGVLPDFDWAVEGEVWGEEPDASLLLLDKARTRMEENSWQFAFVIKPDLESEIISFSHAVAIIGVQSDDSCPGAVLQYLARLNGLRTAGSDIRGALRIDSFYNEQELKELNQALHGLTDGVLERGVKDIRSLALYIRLVLAHPMRVLKAVFSHHPLRMVFSLNKLVFAAVAALILSLLSTELWHLGVGINAWRLALIALAVIVVATLYVVFRQQLFVRKVSLSLSEQAAFFNLTSFLTVLAVFLLLFIAIFCVTMIVALSVYPRYIIEQWLQKDALGINDYIKVCLLISSLALVVAALGAGLEENQHFRQVMYAKKNT